MTSTARIARIAALALLVFVAVPVFALRVHATVQQTGGRLQGRVTAAGNLDSTLEALHPWMRGPESADIRASFAAGELKLEQSTLANKAFSLALSGRAAAPNHGSDPRPRSRSQPHGHRSPGATRAVGRTRPCRLTLGLLRFRRCHRGDSTMRRA